MWLEIISTAVITAVATHLVPHAYSALRAKFVKKRVAVTIQVNKEPPLGNYIVGIDHANKTLALKATPARQTTLIGVDPDHVKAQPVEASIYFQRRALTVEQLEEEIEEAARDREVPHAEMVAHTHQEPPKSELDIEFGDAPAYDPKVGVVPPDYYADFREEMDKAEKALTEKLKQQRLSR